MPYIHITDVQNKLNLQQYLRVGIISLLNSIFLKCGTSAILFSKPSTLVSTVLSPINVFNIFIYNANPPSSMKTLHVVGDSS